jgi:hypothetical protein
MSRPHGLVGCRPWSCVSSATTFLRIGRGTLGFSVIPTAPMSGPRRTRRPPAGPPWCVRVWSTAITRSPGSGLGGRAPRNAGNVTVLWSSLEMAGARPGVGLPLPLQFGGIGRPLMGQVRRRSGRAGPSRASRGRTWPGCHSGGDRRAAPRVAGPVQDRVLHPRVELVPAGRAGAKGGRIAGELAVGRGCVSRRRRGTRRGNAQDRVLHPPNTRH